MLSMSLDVDIFFGRFPISRIISIGRALNLKGTFLLKQNGAFSKIKKSASLFIAKSWGHVPPSTPSSYVYGYISPLESKKLFWRF